MINKLNIKLTDNEIKNRLNPIVDAWFKHKFNTYSEPQRYAIKSIHDNENTLISAPTGTGKTLSAFATILSELINLDEKKQLENKIYAVYISPLKALNNDIEKNLKVPLEDIKKALKKINKTINLRMGIRTSDTTQNQKNQMLKKPPHILITTPESLALMITTKKFINHLKDVRWVVIDEIHALANNKRGTHLSLSLERLENYAKNMVRIGLSATIAPLEEVAKFLIGDFKNKNCNVISINYTKKLSLNIDIPSKFIDIDSNTFQNNIYEKLHNIIQKHRSVLIFTNTRAATERVVHNLIERYPEKYNNENVAAHHSSLSRDLRLETENRLKAGNLKVVVSSTSLELGIDIGYIDAVILLNSPKSIARALQRFGRSGHNLHDKINGYFLVTDFDELIECSIIKKAAYEGKIDKISVIHNALDVLSQHLFGLALEKEQNIDDVFNLIRKSYAYFDLDFTEYMTVLKYLNGSYSELEQKKVFGKIYLDLDKRTFKARGKLARMIYMTNIGVIPDESKVKVKLGGFYIGSLDELFVERLRRGDVFVLGGQTYEFLYMRGLTVFVKTAFQKPPTVPAWFSEMLPLSFDLANMIKIFRYKMQEFFDAKYSKSKIISFLKDYLYETNKDVLANIYDYFYMQYKQTKSFKINVERFETYNYNYVFNFIYGRKVNDVFSTLLGFLVSKQINSSIDISLKDNGFMISSEKKINMQKALNDLFKLSESEFISLLSYAIKNTLLYSNRFRHNAVRFLMILRSYKGKRKTVGRQTMSAKQLINVVEQINPNFPVLEETTREIIYDVMDLENALKIFKELKTQRLLIINLEKHSLFATNIVMNGLSNIIKIEDKLNYLKQIYFYIKNKGF